MAFRGKTAVVTGVSRGIGAAIARAFKEAGARVAGMDLNQASGALDLFVQGMWRTRRPWSALRSRS